MNRNMAEGQKGADINVEIPVHYQSLVEHMAHFMVATLFDDTQFQTGRDSARHKLTHW